MTDGKVIFRAEFSNGYSIRHLFLILSIISLTGGMTVSKDRISITRCNVAQTVLACVSIDRSDDPNGIWLYDWPEKKLTINFLPKDMKTSLEHVRKGAKVVFSLTSKDGNAPRDFDISIIESSENDVNSVKVKLQNREDESEYVVQGSYNSEPSISLPMKELTSVCSNFKRKKADVHIEGYEKGVIMSTSEEGGDFETSSLTVKRGVTDGKQSEANIVVENFVMGAMLPFKNIDSMNGSANFYFKRDLPVKLSSKIYVYGDIDLFLRSSLR